MTARAPEYLVMTISHSGGLFLHEEAACADWADAINQADAQLADFPDVIVWHMPATAPRYDVTAKVKRAIAARYEAGGYQHDTIPTALVDYASDELQRAHADDQAAQLDADIWREDAA